MLILSIEPVCNEESSTTFILGILAGDIVTDVGLFACFGKYIGL